MDKKKFFKKKQIQQTYNNKEKVKQWEERHKKVAFNRYRKELKKMKLPLPGNRIGNDEGHMKRKNEYELAKEEYDRIRKEKQTRKEMDLKRKADIQRSLENYAKKKKFKNKKLFKKTKKGQPIMKDRLQMLLEKIQSQVSQ